MHKRTQITLNAADRSALETIIANRNSPQKHVWRAKIVLLTAHGHGTAEIMNRQGQDHHLALAERFAAEGVAERRARRASHPCLPRWPSAYRASTCRASQLGRQ
jgi:hypothetical protein